MKKIELSQFDWLSLGCVNDVYCPGVQTFTKDKVMKDETFQSITQAYIYMYLEKETPVLPKGVEPMTFQLVHCTSDSLPLSYSRLVVARLGSCDKHPTYC